MSTRYIFVSGAARGIGRAIALAFASPGTQIALADIDAPGVRAAADEVGARGAAVLPIVMDVADAGSVAAGFGQYRARGWPLDVLVNNAGICEAAPVAESDPAGWRRILETNLVGTYLVTRQALPLIRDEGRIVTLSSVLGRMGVAGYSAYCAAKHGIIGFTRALALELVPRRITVNAVCPGWVDTPMSAYGISAGAAAGGVSEEAFLRTAMEAVPIGRMLEPGEVAALVRFLASDAAAGITGQAWNICGGQVMS